MPLPTDRIVLEGTTTDADLEQLTAIVQGLGGTVVDHTPLRFGGTAVATEDLFDPERQQAVAQARPGIAGPGHRVLRGRHDPAAGGDTDPGRIRGRSRARRRVAPGGRPAATVRDAAGLAQVVLDPLLPLIGDRDLVVVPTGLLMTTPWALLPGCAGRPITVASSATAWPAARERRPERAGRAVLVAGPGIPRGVSEVRAIDRLYPGAAVLTGGAAEPGAAIARLDGAGVAHLAAHGRHQAENALFSTLELAGGPLLGYDLQRLARPPSMIVLSSCELGLSDVRPGDESFGMTSALLAAGTSTVVASVSRVADETAMAVMIRFHTAVAAGSAPAPALAAALAGEPTAGFVCLGA